MNLPSSQATPIAKPASWRVGDCTVTRIEEQLGPASFPPARYFDRFDEALLARHRHWLEPNHYLPGSDQLVTSVHAWLIRTPHHTILVDACSGNHKERPWWPRFHQMDTPFLARLAAAGVQPDEVDFVMCTHLHADHIGWNTRLVAGRWVPTFPNARYLFSRSEVEHWDPSRLAAGTDDPPRRIAFVDSVLPVLEAGLALQVEGTHEIDDRLHIEPAPGHTPGHMALQLRQAGAGGVFCGDAIHHPLQVCAPDWNSSFCEDPAQARATRWRLLSGCAEHGHWLFPTHFGAPHVAAVRADGDAFVPEFVEPGP
jgi:glyoxylase-like metal-dependent hydrolase (beta-lactamase superfamily II)